MITTDLLDSITSRATTLSKRYYFLEKEDLMQNGYILLLELEKKELSDLQKHKAVNNMFSNLERHAQYQQRIEKNSSSFDIEPDIIPFEDYKEEILEKEEITRHLLKTLSHQEIIVVEWLSNGWTLDQIAKTLGVNRDRIRRIINHIIEIRKETENAY